MKRAAAFPNRIRGGSFVSISPSTQALYRQALTSAQIFFTPSFPNRERRESPLPTGPDTTSVDRRTKRPSTSPRLLRPASPRRVARFLADCRCTRRRNARRAKRRFRFENEFASSKRPPFYTRNPLLFLALKIPRCCSFNRRRDAQIENRDVNLLYAAPSKKQRRRGDFSVFWTAPRNPTPPKKRNPVI